MMQSKIQKKIEEIAKHYAENVRKSKIKHGIGIAWDDIRYCVLELYEMFEYYVDGIIIKRYIGRNALMGDAVKLAMLSKIDFSRKLLILEDIEDEVKIGIPIDTLKFYNNLRNALVHDYPKGHKFFRYKGGHIYNDLKFDDVCKDAMNLSKKLEKIRDKITPKVYR